MNDREAFSRACALQRDLCRNAMDVVSGHIEMSLANGDDQEARLWRAVRETILQVDLIARCRFSIDGERSWLLSLQDTMPEHGSPQAERHTS